jgi:Ni,Fe-hydrogenase I large subunit
LITKKLIERIEGEASVYFKMKADKVDFASIVFPHFRGMEQILEGKNGLDALVITPRVCGICGHAHLMATVRALEDAYKKSGFRVEISQKAKSIREFTLIMEMIQNHIKWFYMVAVPELDKLLGMEYTLKPLKGAYAASLAAKAIAVFGGQWPHSSYMVPGGVTSDPTYIEILQAKSIVDDLIAFFEKESLGVSIEKFLSFESCKEFNGISSDISLFEEKLIQAGMHQKGFAHDNFLVMGEHSFSKATKLKHTRPYSVDVKYISTQDAYVENSQESYAKNALYKDSYYESGPLARLMASSFGMVKNMHRRYKDSAYSRSMAKVFEVATLLVAAKKLLESIDISEKSVASMVAIENVTAEGIGIVEAPRGPLIHKVTLKDGTISDFTIITPTQFNIGSSSREKPTPVQEAMKGNTQQEALFIFRTFDVCSVCTTH